MSKYHINPATGEPGECQAKFHCRFGGKDEHYDSMEAARAGFELHMYEEAFNNSVHLWREANATYLKKNRHPEATIEVADEDGFGYLVVISFPKTSKTVSRRVQGNRPQDAIRQGEHILKEFGRFSHVDLVSYDDMKSLQHVVNLRAKHNQDQESRKVQFAGGSFS